MHTHTPGPWTCHPTLTPEYDDDPMGCYTVEPAASSLQERFNKADFDSEMLEPIHNENGANARLIAAAPELLDALKDARERLEYLEPDYFDDQSHEAEWRDYLTKIDDLIAKSEGRLPTPRLTANQRKGARL